MKSVPVAAMTIMLTFAAVASSARASATDYVSRVPWNQANVDSLRGADKAAVVAFVNSTRPANVMEIFPYAVVEFGWAKIGDGKSDFVVLFDFSGRGYSNRMWIYRRGSAGNLKIQEIEGWEMHDLKLMFQDLNGDGRDELIVPTELGAPVLWQPLAAMPTWPAVYRLENGRYVEASRDFPEFYDDRILPEITRRLSRAQARLLREPFMKDRIAVSEMERNKILRVLGRNPTAGLNQAYQWMNSDDPTLMQCAIETFTDIGGHDKEVAKLRHALPTAVTREIKRRKGG